MTLIKSKQRVVDHDEVFTPPWMVEAVLDLVKAESERIDARLLEPACGSGNFIARILMRKLVALELKYGKSDFERRHYALLALICTYGIELLARRMPLLEVFISEFLRAVELMVKRGLQSDYSVRQNIVFALRGKLTVATHPRQSLSWANRFFRQFDEFTTDRPENRLLHTALQHVLRLTTSQENQKLARELAFVFADVPVSDQPSADFQRVCIERSMSHYEGALAWAWLVLGNESPLTGTGNHSAPSLLFPMEALFEAFVAKHLQKQVTPGFVLKTQARDHYFVRHQEQDWFRLKPDLLVHDDHANRLVLDTKWKLLDGVKANGSDKYGLSQADFYQLQVYGQSYLDGVGVLALVYPRTAAFDRPLPVFEFPRSTWLKLWVLPFCLKTRKLLFPDAEQFSACLGSGDRLDETAHPGRLRA